MDPPCIRPRSIFAIVTAICALWFSPASGQAPAKLPKLNTAAERCRRINNEHMRAFCFEQIKAKAARVFQQQQPAIGQHQVPPVPQGQAARAGQEPTISSGPWQLARTPNPVGGPATISMTKIVDPTASKREIAGIVLRCAEGATTNVLLVVNVPLPAHAHPKVIVAAGTTTTEFIASVLPPGALVLLPEKASALVEKTWQSVPELAVSIMETNRALHGVVPIEHLSNAVQELQTNCPNAVRGRRQNN